MVPSSGRIHILERVLGLWERTGGSVGHSRLDTGKHLLVHRLPVGVGHGSLGLQLPEQASDWVLLFPDLDLLLGPEVGLADALGVRAPAIGLAFDQRRPLTGPGTGDRTGSSLSHSEDVVAVNDDTGDAVARGAAGHVGHGVRLRRSRLRRIHVVLANI